MVTQFAPETTPAFSQGQRKTTTMSFVNELIPEADKANFDFNVFNESMSNRPIKLTQWTVDRERDAFLLYMGAGGGREGFKLFGLSWKGQLIRFNAVVNGKGNAQQGVELHWKVFGLHFPESLQGQRNEVLTLLREAIDAYGQFGDRTYVSAVKIEVA